MRTHREREMGEGGKRVCYAHMHNTHTHKQTNKQTNTLALTWSSPLEPVSSEKRQGDRQRDRETERDKMNIVKLEGAYFIRCALVRVEPSGIVFLVPLETFCRLLTQPSTTTTQESIHHMTHTEHNTMIHTVYTANIIQL